MSSIEVNDIFEELSEENKRLLNELMFANKCLNVLIKFKTFIDFISDKLKTNLDSNDSQKFEKLNKEVEEVIHQKRTTFELNLKNENLISTKTKKSFNSKKSLKATKRLLTKVVKQNIKKISSVENQKQFKVNCSERNKSSTDINEEPIDGIKQENEENFVCDVEECKYQTTNERNLKQHMSVHNNNKSIVCEYMGCDRRYSSRANMREHYRKHFLKFSFSCDVEGCNYRTWRQIDLTRHISVHNGITPHVCHDCKRGFKTKRLLGFHIIRKHSSSEEFVCNIENCNKTFTNQLSLKGHQKIQHILEKKFMCDYPNCDFRAVCVSIVKQHKDREHSEKSFVCPFEGCSKEFRNRFLLKSHQKCHSLERNHKCSHEGCYKAFKTGGQLRNHELTHLERRIRCEWPGCDYQTNVPKKIKFHQKVHLSEREFICDWPQCGKAFKRKPSLLTHLRIHNCDKRYACSWPGCQYRCVDSGNISKHMKVHQKNKDFI